MAKLNADGKYILSAGEIGSFTVCPEAWRLKTIARVQRLHHDSVETGHRLHTEWAKSFDDAFYLSKGVKFVVFLIALAITLYILTK